MTTSAMQDFLSEVGDGHRIPPGKLAYLQGRMRRLFHQLMLKTFGRLEREDGITRRTLAQRIGRKPEQITRWFSYPGNLTVDTLSDVFVSMGYELSGVVLSNLMTGEKIDFPEQPLAHLDINPPSSVSGGASELRNQEQCSVGARVRAGMISLKGGKAELNQMESGFLTEAFLAQSANAQHSARSRVQ